jgi:hypothetical protein
MHAPFLATDQPIYHRAGIAWGKTVLVSRVRDPEHGHKFGLITLLRQPSLEGPFLMLHEAYRFDNENPGCRDSYLDGLGSLVRGSNFGIDDTRVVEAMRSFFQEQIETARRELKASKVRDCPLAREIADALLLQDRKQIEEPFARFMQIAGIGLSPEQVRAKIRNERPIAVKRHLTGGRFGTINSLDAEGLIEAALYLLGSGARHSFGSLRNGNIEGRHERIATSRKMAGA